MDHRPRIRFRVRTAAAAATLAMHGLFLLVLTLEDRDLMRPLPAPRRLVGMWIHLPVLAPPQPPPQVETPVPPRAAPVVVRPPTAITLAPAITPTPAPGPMPSPDSPASPGATDIESRPWTDWELEAQKLAARREFEAESAGFSGEVQAMREPCKPHRSSMWPKKPVVEDAPPGWEAAAKPPPGSVMMGGTRVGVVPLVGIPLGGPKPEPNKHLFDDMMAGKTPRSSVPDPNVCD